MATDTTTPYLTVAREWDTLLPAMPEPKAHTKHVRLIASVSYLLGQSLAPHDTLAGTYVPPGHANAVAASWLVLLQYPCTTDANRNASFGAVSIANDQKLESVPVFYSGCFFVRDLVGIVDGAMLARLGHLVQGKAFDDPDAIVMLG